MKFSKFRLETTDGTSPWIPLLDTSKVTRDGIHLLDAEKDPGKLFELRLKVRNLSFSSQIRVSYAVLLENHSHSKTS